MEAHMFAILSRYWWVLVVRGVLAVVLGVFAFARPRETITALVIAFGAVALVDGIFALAAAIAGRKLTPDWWVLLVQGLLGIGVGVLTLAKPQVTATALLIYIALWAVGMGVLQVIAAVKLRHEITGEWWVAIGGAASVVFGILLMRHPSEGALAVLWLIGAYALVWGVMLVLGGFDIRRLSKHAAA
jgi:uncharacterized membrane protein HdeD (DUF308 family)